MLRPILTLFLISHIAVNVNEVSATTITLFNKCNHQIWPGLQPTTGKPIIAQGGFNLPSNKAYTIQLPSLWSGRIWARDNCTFDAMGRGHCTTGDCGGTLTCNGLGGTPPTTLAEFTFGNDQDFYDVSLVDGYNLPLTIMPLNGNGKCELAGCVRDLNAMCPVSLQVMSRDLNHVVACKSACSALNSPRFCCTGSYGSPQACKPTVYSRIFKVACPKAYSYAFDDPTSIVTCYMANYLVTFCPT